MTRRILACVMILFGLSTAPALAQSDLDGFLVPGSVLMGPIVGASVGNNFREARIGWTFESDPGVTWGLTIDLRHVEPNAELLADPHRSEGIDVGVSWYSPIHSTRYYLQPIAGLGIATRVHTEADRSNTVRTETLSLSLFIGAAYKFSKWATVGADAIGIVPVYLDHLPGYSPDGYRWSYGLRMHLMFHLIDGMSYIE